MAESRVSQSAAHQSRFGKRTHDEDIIEEDIPEGGDDDEIADEVGSVSREEQSDEIRESIAESQPL
jgi:hypothetical protein